MINLFRKNQRILMLIIAVLTIIAFVWLYDPYHKSPNAGPSVVATVYGNGLSQTDIEREVRSYSLALAMQQFDLLINLGGMAENENMAVSEFIFNLLVLQHEADKLGVYPTDSQIAERIKSLPVLQTRGQFDLQKYQQFVAEQLGPKGFTEEQMNKVMRDSLRLERLKEIVGAPMAVSDAELLEAGRIFQKIDVQQVKFPASAAEALVTVSEEEIQGFYARNKPTLIMPETRVVEFVEFTPPAGEKADGAPSIEAQQKLADAASAFAEKAAASSFEQATAAAGLKTQTSPEFDRSGATPAQAGALAEDLKLIAPSAFLLSETSPVSDVVQAGSRFYVIKLAKVNPQREMTLEEVRPMAEIRMKGAKAERLLHDSADAALAKVREAMAGGKTFADAATAAGLKVETINALDLTSKSLPPEQERIAQASLMMQPGQLSGFLPTPDGGTAVYLTSRAPLDEAAFASQKSDIEANILENKKRLLFLSWLASAREAAKISMTQTQRSQ